MKRITSLPLALLSLVGLALVLVMAPGDTQTPTTIGNLPTNPSPQPYYYTIVDDGASHTWKSTLGNVVGFSLGGLPLSVANGGTATSAPSPVASTCMAISGTWPSQTYAYTCTTPPPLPLSIANGGTGVTSFTSGNCVRASSTTTLASAAGDCVTSVTAGTGISVSGSTAVTVTATAVYAETIFTGSGTFTTPSNSSTSTVYRYRMVGGGGGGGGANGSAAVSGGGGGGATAEGTFTGVAANTGITVTVGAAGTAGANTGGTGGAGGATSLGTPVSVSCPGGSGGVGSTASAYPVGSSGGAGGSVPTGGGALVWQGQHGFPGVGSAVANAYPGTGGNSMLGLGGGTNSAGADGLGYGGGGSGAFGTTAAGGAGAPGVVIIDRMTP